MCEFEGWRLWVEPAVLLWKPSDHDYEKPSYMTWKDGAEPELTPDQEYSRIDEEVKRTDGFEIDFSGFHCVFNYHPAVFKSHQFADAPETTEDVLKRLSQEALDDYNKEKKTEYKFVQVAKANYHWSSAIMFLITFDVIDPYDNFKKLFQARVRYAKRLFTEHVFYRPKPNQGAINYKLLLFCELPFCISIYSIAIVLIVLCIGKYVEEDVEKDVENDAE